jgi:hypothetical protein
VWIEGSPCVGSVLCGRVYYFGGTEGKSRCWWTRINADGDATDVTPAVEIPAPAGLNEGADFTTPACVAGVQEDVWLQPCCCAVLCVSAAS